MTGYSVGALLGRGGQGEVFRAVHEATGTPVAIKTLLRQSRAGEASLLREVRTMASLVHPGVVVVHDVGTGRQGVPWFAMELATSCLAMAPPEGVGGIRAVLLAVLDALAHTHARGVLHRDLKPSNVLWIDGQPRLADFGLAWTLAQGQEKETLGSPLFAPPEQITGEALSPATDLYAVGWMAWTWLAGGHPWGARSAPDVVFAQLTEPLPPRDALPAAFVPWLEQLLDKNPARRFARAADAARALVLLDLDADAPLRALPTPDLATLDLGLMVGAGAVASPSEEWSTAATSQAPPFREWRPDPQRRNPPLPSTGLGLLGMRELPVFGRERERDAMWEALRAAHRGEVRALRVHGVSGYGSTRLGRWLCERAHELGLASVVACSGDGLLEVAESMQRVLGPPPDDAFAVRRVLDGRPADGADVAAGLWRWAQGGDRGRALVLWLNGSGPESLLRRIGASSADRDGGGPGLLVLHTGREAPGLLGVPSVRLEALPSGDMQSLARHLMGASPALVQRLVHRTGGHPAMLVALARDWGARGVLAGAERGLQLAPEADTRWSGDQAQWWRERMEALPLSPEERSALARLGVTETIGGPLAEDDWQRVTAPVGERLEAVLAAHGWLVRGQGTLAIAHRPVLEALSQGANREVHAAILQRLDGRLQPGTLGLHLAGAERGSEALGCLKEGARWAMNHDRLADAELFLLAAVQCAAGPEQEAQVELLQARYAFWRGRAAEAGQRMRAVLTSIDGASFDALLWGANVASLLRAPEALPWAEAAVARASTAEERAVGLRAMAEAHIAGGEFDGAGRALEACRCWFAASDDPGKRASWQHTHGSLARIREDHPSAERAFGLACEGHLAAGNGLRAANALSGLGDALRAQSRLGEAVAAYERGLRLGEDLLSTDVDMARLNLAYVEIARRRFRAAEPGLRRSAEAFAREGVPFLEAAARYGLLVCAADANDPTTFDREFDRIAALGGAEGTAWADPEIVGVMRAAVEAWRGRDPVRASRCARFAAGIEAALGRVTEG